jgi:hypothetical protein
MHLLRQVALLFHRINISRRGMLYASESENRLFSLASKPTPPSAKSPSPCKHLLGHVNAFIPEQTGDFDQDVCPPCMTMQLNHELHMIQLRRTDRLCSSSFPPLARLVRLTLDTTSLTTKNDFGNWSYRSACCFCYSTLG